MNQIPFNVEKSAFNKGYIGWDGNGHIWTIVKEPRGGTPWVARPGASHPSRWLTPVRGKSLKSVAEAIARRAHSSAPVEPF